MTITVNERIPGPAIIVYENQKVVVHVHNLLLSDSVTIHWHGLHMKGTPWMDGVGWISQCPIGSGQTFSYEFKVNCARARKIMTTNTYYDVAPDVRTTL